MQGCIWGGNNIPLSSWIELLLLELAKRDGKSDLQALKKPSTLANAVEWLQNHKGVDVDTSTLSRMKQKTNCHDPASVRVQSIRSAIIQSISLDTCFLYFERQLLSSMMFANPHGDLMHHARQTKSPNGLYEAYRYSLKGKKRITKSAFLFYRNEKNHEPLSGYSEVDSGVRSREPLSEIHRYRELRKITPPNENTEPYFIHVRGFVFLQNNGFYLIGFGMETESPKPTSQLNLKDIRRSQIENEFLEDDLDPNVVRGIKTGFLRAPAHPVSSILHLEKKQGFHPSSWDSVGKTISIGTIVAHDFKKHDILEFAQDEDNGMLTVCTL